MKKILFSVVVSVSTIVVVIGIQFFLPRITSSSVVLYDEADTFSGVPNTKLKVTYYEGCSSSPCASPNVIFDGYTDEHGKIELSGWHLSHLNRCGVGDVVYDCYSFELEGYSNDYFHIERGGKAFMMFFDKL